MFPYVSFVFCFCNSRYWNRIASAIVLSLDCADDQVKLIIFKQNSGNNFHQREESVSIRGVIDSTLHTFIQEKPLYAFSENRTTEYCVPKTKDLVYEVVLLDSYDSCLLSTVEREMDGMMERTSKFVRVQTFCFSKGTANRERKNPIRFDVLCFFFILV